MKKLYYSMLVIVFMTFLMIPGISASASVGYTLTDGVLTVFGTGTVTAADWDKETNMNVITSLVVEEGITGIGNSAFSFCENLTSVTLPNSVTSIDIGAFYDCLQVSKLTLSAELNPMRFWFNSPKLKTAGPVGGDYDIQFRWTTSIPELAFSQFSYLESVVLPDTITTIGKNAFRYCSRLKSIVIPASVARIEEGTFADCRELKSVDLPDGITFIGKEAFLNCFSITELKLPAMLQIIGESAFSGCKISECVLPQGVESVGRNVFGPAATSLTSVVIPEKLTDIHAFTECGFLTTAGPVGGMAPNGRKINIQLGWKNMIPADAFSKFNRITYVGVPKGITTIGTGAFSHCNSLYMVELPEGITHIYAGTFVDCRSLGSVSIPASVTAIDEGAFVECPRLVILGEAGSAAEAYAKAANIPFKASCKVTFVTNKGEISGNSVKEYRVGEKYGVLPTMKDGVVDGLNFEGWFTQEEGGVQITAETICEASAPTMTLYAHWGKGEKWADYKFGIGYDGNYILYENGVQAPSKYGFVTVSGVKCLVVAGRPAVGINGLYNDPEHPEDWYFLAEGRAQTQHTGLVSYDGAWFYVSQGKMDSTVGGYVSYDGGLFFVGVGRIMTEVNGLAQDPKNPTDWYFLANGQAQTQYTGLAQYDGAWFYVVNGKLASDYSGTVSYDGSQFTVVNGMLQK